MALGPHVTPAPFFCLTRVAWIPYAPTWEPETGEFHGVEGPRAFATYREALEASRFLKRGPGLDRYTFQILG